MPEVRSPDDLLTVGQVAALCGVRHSAVSNWRTRNPDFPKPWGIWGAVRLYLRSDIDEFLAQHTVEGTERKRRQLEALRQR